MFRNRFLNCKSIRDLQKVLVGSNISYRSLSSEEIDTINEIFETVMPGTGITVKASFDYERVIKIIKDNLKEDNNMSVVSSTNKNEIKNNINLAVDEIMGKFAEAKANAKVVVGENRKQFIKRTDDSLNIMKGAFGSFINFIDVNLGFTSIKEGLLAIMEAGTDGANSFKSIDKMAQECRKLIDKEVEFISKHGDEEDLKRAMSLKALSDGSRGQSIFEAFASGIISITRKAMRKLRKWSHIDDEKSIIGAVCRSLAGFANALKAGLQILWEATKFAVSFLVAGVIKLATYITEAVKTAISNVKSWRESKHKVITEDDIEEE